MFFETDHSIPHDQFQDFFVQDTTFPLHLHRAFECLTQWEGSTEVRIDERTCLLQPGEAVLIFPFQQHAYLCRSSGAAEITIFSPDMVESFARQFCGRAPLVNRFHRATPTPEHFQNTYLTQAFCYDLCGQFLSQCPDFGAPKKGNDLLAGILTYIEEHYQTDCSLWDAAQAVGYDYAYISKRFKQWVHMTFKEYVNARRIQQSMYELSSTDASIEAIIERCGFRCSRTFNRQFSLLVGMTPSAYRKRQQQK